MSNVKTISFYLPEHVHFHFKNKCQFYDIKFQEVLPFMIEKFIDGEFDEDLGIGDKK